MSFVEAEDVMAMIDGLMARLAKEILGLDVPLPLPRMTYDEAMRRFGHDAPDLRFGMEIVDCTDLAAECEFRVFQSAAQRGDFVRGIRAPQAAAQFSRKRIDELTEYIKQDFGAQGLVWFRVTEAGQLESSAAKNFTAAMLAQIAERMEAAPGDVLLFVADTWEVTCKALYGLRKRLGAELKLYDPRQMHFSWVVEFPMFEFDKEEQRWVAMHHPFTSPRPQDIPLLDTDPGKCRAQAYDLVINGYEAGGGTIRIHDSQAQQKVFDLLGIDPPTARERFGFLLDALQFGAPPHGGIALGIDRVVMLFGGLDNIRDCIAFPKTQRATDMMTEAPGAVDARQLQELGLPSKSRKLNGSRPEQRDPSSGVDETQPVRETVVALVRTNLETEFPCQIEVLCPGVVAHGVCLVVVAASPWSLLVSGSDLLQRDSAKRSKPRSAPRHPRRAVRGRSVTPTDSARDSGKKNTSQRAANAAAARSRGRVVAIPSATVPAMRGKDRGEAHLLRPMKSTSRCWRSVRTIASRAWCSWGITCPPGHCRTPAASAHAAGFAG